MAELNPHFQNLKDEYIFPIIEKRLDEMENRDNLLNFGIGDTSLPLAPTIADAIKRAITEMTTDDGKRGYGPAEGYFFLREAISKNEYVDYGIQPDEIFISDGSTIDATSILELFDDSCIVGITDPTYPLYRDAAILSGKKLIYVPTSEENGFVPKPPSERIDLMYLCTPNNPTGIAMTRAELKVWIDWAKENHSILIIDKVYSAFISSSDVPKSLYEIEGAKDVVIEIGSFSKFAGFTGLRCGHMVLPKSIKGQLGGSVVELHTLWARRTASVFNGFSYPIQKGAEACYTAEGRKQTRAQVESYKQAGKILRKGLKNLGEQFFGGIDCPYIFWKTPQEQSSWEFFETLLKDYQILAIPGSGFGKGGEGFVRLSCFSTSENAQKAIERLETLAIRN